MKTKLREKLIERRSEIVKKTGGLIVLNCLVNDIYDEDDLLFVERCLDNNKNFN